MYEAKTDERTCIGCGYPLRGLPANVCPECGRPFDPRIPSTYDHPARPRSWRRWAKPPPIGQLLLLLGCTVYCVWIASSPGGLWAIAGGFVGPCFMAPIGLLLLAYLLGDYASRVHAVIKARAEGRVEPASKRNRRRWRWALLPVCIAIVTSAAFTHWPLRVRFHYSRPAFELVVRDVQATDSRWETRERRIGLFHVKSIYQFRNGTVRFETGWIGFDGVGIEYRPNDRPGDPRRIAPCWFVWSG